MTRAEKKAAIFDVLGGDMDDQEEHSFVDAVLDHEDEMAAILSNRNPRLAGYPSCDDSEQLPIT